MVKIIVYYTFWAWAQLKVKKVTLNDFSAWIGPCPFEFYAYIAYFHIWKEVVIPVSHANVFK